MFLYDKGLKKYYTMNIKVKSLKENLNNFVKSETFKSLLIILSIILNLMEMLANIIKNIQQIIITF